MTQAANWDSLEFTSAKGGVPTGSGQVPIRPGQVPPPLQRKQISAPRHAVLLGVKGLLRHFGLLALLIACAGQLYPRESNFPTSIFDGVRDVKARPVGGSRRSAGERPALHPMFDIGPNH
jgi:hypothetical protein